MTSYEKSAIIGYWRCGATWKEISSLMGITVKEAKKIVNFYLKSIK
jgi:hypothetical protein